MWTLIGHWFGLTIELGRPLFFGYLLNIIKEDRSEEWTPWHFTVVALIMLSQMGGDAYWRFYMFLHFGKVR
jgi:hypothetical protein